MPDQPGREEVDRARQAVAIHGRYLSALPNVVGFGVGYRVVAGRDVEDLAVAVFVRRKQPIEILTGAGSVPRSLAVGGDLVPTDVVEVGNISLLQDWNEYRPLLGGSHLPRVGSWDRNRATASTD